MIPQTDFILVRGPRTDSTGNPIEIVVSIQRNNGKFDFSDYSFLRMKPNSKDPVEEWVPTKELDVYNKSFGVEGGGAGTTVTKEGISWCQTYKSAQHNSSYSIKKEK